LGGGGVHVSLRNEERLRHLVKHTAVNTRTHGESVWTEGGAGGDGVGHGDRLVACGAAGSRCGRDAGPGGRRYARETTSMVASAPVMAGASAEPEMRITCFVPSGWTSGMVMSSSGGAPKIRTVNPSR